MSLDAFVTFGDGCDTVGSRHLYHEFRNREKTKACRADAAVPKREQFRSPGESTSAAPRAWGQKIRVAV